MARRLKCELTPAQVKKLYLSCKKDVALFEKAIEDLGYKKLSNQGCFKIVYAMPRGRYVIKVGLASDSHTNGNAIRQRYLASRRRGRRVLLPTLVSGRTFHVQRRVKECTCYAKVRGYLDTEGHNHTHMGGRIVVFDY